MFEQEAEQDNLINKSAERELLGAVFCDNKLIAHPDLTEDLFTTARYQLVLRAMKEVAKKDNEPVSYVTVTQYLANTNQLNENGVDLLTLNDLSVATKVGSIGKSDIKLLKGLLLKRRVREVARKIEWSLANEDIDPDVIASKLQDEMNEIVKKSDKTDGAVDTAQNMVNAYKRIYDQAKSGETGLKTGFIDLDNWTGGLKKKKLYILAARPGMGKTAFALNIVKNLSYLRDKTVAVFSLEMGQDEVEERILSSLSGVDGIKFSTPEKMTHDDWVAFRNQCVMKRKGHSPVVDTGGLTVREIEHSCRATKMKYGLDLVVIDYIGLMNAVYAKPSDRVAVVTEITKDLKALSKKLDVPILALCQLNRGVEGRQDKRPMMSDLRESGSIEQDADMIMFLYRDSYYDPDSPDKHSELIIRKHRGGPLGTINLYFDSATTTFKSLSQEGMYK